MRDPQTAAFGDPGGHLFCFASLQMDDECYYDEVAKELANQQLRPGLWAKAIAESAGSESAARARYIKLRAQQLKDAASATKIEQQKEGIRRGAQRARTAAITGIGRIVLALSGVALCLFGILFGGGGITSLLVAQSSAERVAAVVMLLMAFAAGWGAVWVFGKTAESYQA